MSNGVLITRLKSMPVVSGGPGWQQQPALKICITVGLSRKEVEKAGTTIRHAITKIVSGRKSWGI